MLGNLVTEVILMDEKEVAKIFDYLSQFSEMNGIPVFANRWDITYELGKELIKNKYVEKTSKYKYWGQQHLDAPCNAPQYKFLVDNELLGNNIFYITRGGSHAYGTNISESDYDIRGGYLENPRCLFSIEKQREEFVDTETDTCLYSFRKFIKLMVYCNPNTIELLGTRPEDVIYTNYIGEMLRENYRLFLSQRVFYTFSSYATQQLRRLQNALARDSYPQPEKERHILKTVTMDMLTSGKTFNAYLLDKRQTNNNGSVFDIALDVQPTQNGEFEQEIFIEGTMKHLPLREYINLNSKLANTIKNYGLLTHRSKKKDETHLNKHAMHLIRLYFMGIDILKKQEIITYREKEHDLLMTIRQGEMKFEKIFELQKKLEIDMFDALENTKLPAQPNMTAINDFLMSIYKKHSVYEKEG